MAAHQFEQIIYAMDEWENMAQYDTNFLENELDFLEEQCDQQLFNAWCTEVNDRGFMEDILIAHRIIQSGVPSRYGLRIPLKTKWNVELMEILLAEYQDKQVTE